MSASVDEGIAGLIEALWRWGIFTVFSCQGTVNHDAYIDFPRRQDVERFRAMTAPIRRPGWRYSEWVSGSGERRYRVQFPSSELDTVEAAFEDAEGVSAPWAHHASS